MNLLRRRTALITVSLFVLLTLVLGWFARDFRIDASADTLLTQGNKQYIKMLEMDQRYQPSDFILIAFKPNNKDIYSTEVLTQVSDLVEKLGQIPRVKNVRSIINVPLFAAAKNLGPNIKPEDLSWKTRQFKPEKMRRILTDHPLYTGLLVNKDQNALSIQVVFSVPQRLSKISDQVSQLKITNSQSGLDKKQTRQLKQLKKQESSLKVELNKTRMKDIDQIRQLTETYQSSGEWYLGGTSLLAYQLKKIILRDLVFFGVAIVVLVGVILFFLFRRLKWIVIPLLCCGISVMATLGLLGLLNLKVTVISTNVIALQIILTLAVVIHLIVQYQEELEKSPSASQEELVRKALKAKLKPCIYAALTTAIGFGSLVFSGIKPVISFGWMMMIAMAATLVVSLLLFPALTVLTKKDQKSKKHSLIEKAISVLSHWVDKGPRRIGLVTVVLAAIGVGGCFLLTAENSFINYFSQSTDVYRELSYIDKHFGGSTALDVLYTIPKAQRKPDLVISAEAMQSVGKIQNLLRSQKAVGNITSVEDFTRIASVAAGKPITEYELTALYRALDKDLRDSLFADYFSAEHHQLRISTRIIDTTPDLNRREFLKHLHQGMDDLGIAPSDYQFTNLFVLYQGILERLIRSQVLTAGIVYLAMAAVLFGVFRSLKIAIITLIPNIFTTLIVLGAMGISGISLDLMTMTITAVAMGISVDDTIHYTHRYLQEANNHQASAVSRAHASVGQAMIYTTLIIILGFSCLMFSKFIPSVMFGLLTAIAMATALLTDMLLLPALLKRFVAVKS